MSKETIEKKIKRDIKFSNALEEVLDEYFPKMYEETPEKIANKRSEALMLFAEANILHNQALLSQEKELKGEIGKHYITLMNQALGDTELPEKVWKKIAKVNQLILDNNMEKELEELIDECINIASKVMQCKYSFKLSQFNAQDSGCIATIDLVQWGESKEVPPDFELSKRGHGETKKEAVIDLLKELKDYHFNQKQ